MNDNRHSDTGLGSYERDPGLAAERTELAWGRSVLALLACGAAVVKGLPKVTGVNAHPGAGLVLLVIGGLVWLCGVPYSRARQAAARSGRPRRVRSRELAPIAIGTAAVGVAAFVIAAFLPN